MMKAKLNGRSGVMGTSGYRRHKTDDKPMCGRCYEEVEETFPPNCAEKPEELIGEPLGQYHCPNCGAMLIAGIPHPNLCKRCLDRVHPGIDTGPKEAQDGIQTDR